MNSYPVRDNIAIAHSIPIPRNHVWSNDGLHIDATLEPTIENIRDTFSFMNTDDEKTRYIQELTQLDLKHVDMLKSNYLNKHLVQNSYSKTIKSKGMEVIGLDTAGKAIETQAKTSSFERISNWTSNAQDAVIACISFGLIRKGYQIVDKYFFKPLVTFNGEEMEINFGAALQKIIKLSVVTLFVVTSQISLQSKLAGGPFVFRASVLRYLTPGLLVVGSLVIPETYSLLKNRSEYTKNYAEYQK